MRIDMYEADTYTFDVDVPTELQGGKATLLIKLNSKEGILKDIASVGAKANFQLERGDTATRVGVFNYEIRVVKGSVEKVIVNDIIKVKNSIIVIKDVVPTPLVAIILSSEIGTQGGGGSSASLKLGETATTAYAGDKGKKNADDIAQLKWDKLPAAGVARDSYMLGGLAAEGWAKKTDLTASFTPLTKIFSSGYLNSTIAHKDKLYLTKQDDKLYHYDEIQKVYKEISKQPTKLSELESDKMHMTVTDSERSTWYGKSDFSGNYNDLTNKPDLALPADVVRDSNYIHTDYNFDKTSRDKLISVVNYDDTAVKASIDAKIDKTSLRGLRPNGVVDVYTGKLSDIDHNSIYNFASNSVSDAPEGLGNVWGFVQTFAHTHERKHRMQIVYPMNTVHYDLYIRTMSPDAVYPWRKIEADPFSDDGYLATNLDTFIDTGIYHINSVNCTGTKPPFFENGLLTVKGYKTIDHSSEWRTQEYVTWSGVVSRRQHVVVDNTTNPQTYAWTPWACERKPIVSGRIGSIDGDTIATGSNIPFNEFFISDDRIEYRSATKDFLIKEAGVYRITFDAFVAVANPVRVKIFKTEYGGQHMVAHAYKSVDGHMQLPVITMCRVLKNEIISFELTEGKLYNKTHDRFNEFTIEKIREL